jgi:hypothetical protein
MSYSPPAAECSNQIGEFNNRDGCKSKIHKSLTTGLQIHCLRQGNNAHFPSANIFSMATIVDAKSDLWFYALRAIPVKYSELN